MNLFRVVVLFFCVFHSIKLDLRLKLVFTCESRCFYRQKRLPEKLERTAVTPYSGALLQ
jgi:hypothetical protein